MDPRNLNSHLFDSDFQNIHGMTLQQASEGYSNRSHTIAQYLGKNLVSPEEQDEVWNEWKRTNQLGALTPPEGPVREVTKQVFSEPVDVGKVAEDWMWDHKGLLFGGSPQYIARKAIALSDALRAGTTPTTRIYRGAVTPPQQQALTEPDLPIAFTEDPYVARSFARPSNRGAGGRVYKVDPTTEKGIYIPDIVPAQRRVGKESRPEKEWLIDPTTIKVQE